MKAGGAERRDRWSREKGARRWGHGDTEWEGGEDRGPMSIRAGRTCSHLRQR